MIENAENTKSSKKPKKLYLIIFSLCFAFILFFILCRVLFYKSPEQQLAAIDASRAIPDSENAAIIYNQLLEDYNESYFEPAFLNNNIETITRTTPWSSQDYPELVNWLEQNQNIIEKLFEVSQYENYFYPITMSYTDYLIGKRKHLSPVKQLVFFLIRSGNNDVAENRIDQALEKYINCIRIGRHFSQQPLAIDFLAGLAMEGVSLQRIRYLLVYKNLSDEQIKTIETLLPYPKLDEYYKAVLNVEAIYNRMMLQQFSLFSRLIHKISYIGKDDPSLKRLQEIFLRFAADRHGTQIVIALKRYKYKNGKWPEKLDEIKPYLSSEDIIIDPQNNGSFVYKLKDNSFILYSTGPNRIDENGKIKAPGDDWLIWPLRTFQTQTKNTSIEPNDITLN